MEEVNCNVSFEQLSFDELSRIESVCKSVKHLSEHDNLFQILKGDEDSLFSRGIRFSQLRELFNKIKLHFDHGESDGVPKLIQNKLVSSAEKIQANITNGWCLWSQRFKTLFNGRLYVQRYTWGGAEACPFKSLKDEQYHGYEYGSHDWIFMNASNFEVIHIGDLLFHEISEHHFNIMLISINL